MDHCAQPDLLTFDRALELILSCVDPVVETENISLVLAQDRILAKDILAGIHVPAADNSAMDGYAICLDDSQEYSLVGHAFAGHAFDGEISAGQAVRIMTGGIIPDGANAVVMQENVLVIANKIEILQMPQVGENIRRKGEDIRMGSLVLSSGTRITALHIGLLASIGLSNISVFRKIRVALLSTGDELLQPGDDFVSGKIYDSNRAMLHALLQRLPVELIDLGCIADNPTQLEKTFSQAATQVDVIISSGGVSVGEADYTKDVLHQLGDIGFYKIAMKPGKPLAFGRFKQNNCWFFGLPGNPVSSAITYHQLVVPGIRRLSGEFIHIQQVLPGIASQLLKKQPGRMDFQRGILFWEHGVAKIKSAGKQSSGVLTGMANANAYICLEAERGTVAEGESVIIIPFDRYIE